jgi:hypothetical protein
VDRTGSSPSDEFYTTASTVIAKYLQETGWKQSFSALMAVHSIAVPRIFLVHTQDCDEKRLEDTCGI